MSRLIFLSEIHETEALSPKSSSAATITPLNQKVSSSTSIVSVLCLVISVLALVIIFLGVLHLIFKFLFRSSTLLQIRNFNINSELSPSSPQLQHLFVLHDSGLDQTAIDALPVFLYGDVTMSLREPFDCAVCLCEFSDMDKLRLLPVCSHAFHLHCIDTWLLSNTTCPLCRQSLSTSNICFNHAETLVVPFSRLEQVDEGRASLGKRVFSVRLGRYKSMNGSQSESESESQLHEVKSMNGSQSESQQHEVKGETGVPRRCYSMGTHQYLECDQDFVVALSLSHREGKTGINCSVHEGKSVKQNSDGLGRF